MDQQSIEQTQWILVWFFFSFKKCFPGCRYGVFVCICGLLATITYSSLTVSILHSLGIKMGLQGSCYLFLPLHLAFLQLCKLHCFNFMQDVVFCFGYIRSKFKSESLLDFFWSGADESIYVFYLAFKVKLYLNFVCVCICVLIKGKPESQTPWSFWVFQSWAADEILICMPAETTHSIHQPTGWSKVKLIGIRHEGEFNY